MNKKVKIRKMIVLVVLIVTSIITTMIVSCKRDNEQNAQLTENCDEFENSENIEKITGIFLITKCKRMGSWFDN